MTRSHRNRCRTPTALASLLAAACGLAAARSMSDDPPPASAGAAPVGGTEAGQFRNDNGLGLALVWCPPGVVTMGDSEEAGVRAVLTRGYWLGRFEITQGEWKRVMGTEPWRGQGFVGDDLAATWVSWDDATGFCAKLTDQERTAGRIPADWRYTLPTEAQWEHACRARSTTLFCFGDDLTLLTDYAWCGATKGRAPMPGPGILGQPLRVGGKKPNAWGIHDMHGNVWEWCRDYYADTPPGGRNPETTAGEPLRTIRGGSWWNGALDCRSARRDRYVPGRRDFSLGFRVALAADPQ